MSNVLTILQVHEISDVMYPSVLYEMSYAMYQSVLYEILYAMFSSILYKISNFLLCSGTTRHVVYRIPYALVTKHMKFPSIFLAVTFICIYTYM